MCPSLIAETERGLPHHLPSATHYRRLRANSIGAAISGRPGDLGGEGEDAPLKIGRCCGRPFISDESQLMTTGVGHFLGDNLEPRWGIRNQRARERNPIPSICLFLIPLEATRDSPVV
ncbi:hypothetical protein TNIN_27621 [Trichonephila inaurata madagascariensis]|uniref:Uncharacterized protein n=1 Tax=Trichonephila inaurata madagascariensis TaxID=2747483 RepID=A0A8X6YEB2_9ARAC|nr:hypothetical protein TNIN_27621 [Trichonephila inaurata madagascariensis]